MRGLSLGVSDSPPKSGANSLRTESFESLIRLTIQIVYFQSLRRIVGIDSEAWNSSAPNLAGLIEALCMRHPALAPHAASLMLAVNGEHADLESRGSLREPKRSDP